GGIRRRAPPERRPDGARDHAEHARVAGERPLELARRLVGVREREVRRGEEPLAVGEAPVLGEPAVEGAEGGALRRKTAAQRLVHAGAGRREGQALLDALAVEQREPRLAVAVGWVDRLELAEECAQVAALRVAPAVELVEASGPRHRVEGRVRDEAVDP